MRSAILSIKSLTALSFCVLATLAPVVEAKHKDLEIYFDRSLDHRCLESFHKRVKLENTHCKTFDEDEGPFSYFRYTFEEPADGNRGGWEDCEVVVHTEPNCQGGSKSTGSLMDMMDKCLSTTWIGGGRSASVMCAGDPFKGHGWKPN